ncbi:MAG: sigma-70 family RNA polymerase sigma factor [Defluviitaleaceae bacterium]|nr:sigma-70 family RNA polymerase sigma factor [Defluviitaleaceae bacterium]
MYLRANKKHNAVVSLQDSMSSDREGNSITLEDKLPDDGENLADIVALRMQVGDLYDAMGVLDKREREIVLMRYGLAGLSEVTQREIGYILGISRSYVSRIEKRALAKLFCRLGKV